MSIIVLSHHFSPFFPTYRTSATPSKAHTRTERTFIHLLTTMISNYMIIITFMHIAIILLLFCAVLCLHWMDWLLGLDTGFG